ncbi:MAG: 5-formyltetrahydrofolate cyclo-ligase [Asticcacaulis sp.]
MKEAKALLRKDMKARRAAAFSADPEAGERLAAGFRLWLPQGTVVAGYSAFGSEMNPLPLMRVLAAKDCKLALPALVATEAGLRMVFRAFDLGDELTEGPYGIVQPSDLAPEVLPDIVLVPLLAFDRQGHRLGYGGGFYDRGLRFLKSQKPFKAWGIAYAAQAVHHLPVEDHDQPLDAVLTETGLIETETD